MGNSPDIVNLNNPDLDIQELERRLELATTMLSDAWCDCDGLTPCTLCECHCGAFSCDALDPCACHCPLCDCYGFIEFSQSQ